MNWWVGMIRFYTLTKTENRIPIPRLQAFLNRWLVETLRATRPSQVCSVALSRERSEGATEGKKEEEGNEIRLNALPECNANQDEGSVGCRRSGMSGQTIATPQLCAYILFFPAQLIEKADNSSLPSLPNRDKITRKCGVGR